MNIKPTFDKPYNIAIIGAGVRGTHLGKQLAQIDIPSRIVAVAEPVPDRREVFAREYNLPSAAQFDSWETLTSSPVCFDAAIVATLDNQHSGPALACLDRGSHILIEKPLADTFEDCVSIVRKQRTKGLVISVCLTLRYMEAFKKIKDIVAAGVLGKLVHIEHMDAIDYLRFSHNYVRGRWAKERDNTFLLLHKCSHDVDFIAWLINTPCSTVSSFGRLTYFLPANALPGSGRRCLDDCQIQKTCPYSAMRLYVDNDLTGRVQDLSQNLTRDARLEAVKFGPFGKCVWHAGNDVVDHQVVLMEFADGVTATCTLSGFSTTHGRRTRVQGTSGELSFDEASGQITIKLYAESRSKRIMIKKPDIYHPEDRDIVENWLKAVMDRAAESNIVTAAEALQTHAIVFAAELARTENRVVEMDEFGLY